jgi:hypothetical protein
MNTALTIRTAVLGALLALAACSAPLVCPPNTLTGAETELGWRLLFDGESLEGWHLYGLPGETTGWAVEDGAIARVGPGGDLVSARQYANFELRLQWRISPGGNSGIVYRVADGQDAVWRTGPEMQVLDNQRQPDGRNAFTSAGSVYALYPPPRDVTRPIGEWNDVHLIVRGNAVEHWLNGERQCAYVLGSEEWTELVAASKFASMPGYGLETRGRLALQNHGDPVWFRAIKLRVLD